MQKIRHFLCIKPLKNKKNGYISCQKFRISAHVGALLIDKFLIVVLAKWCRYSNIFLINNVVNFLKYIGINNYGIKLKLGK